jgi:hypothetical protein
MFFKLKNVKPDLLNRNRRTTANNKTTHVKTWFPL